MATSLLQVRVEDPLKNGLSDMSLDEINAEIEAFRNERKVSG